MVVGAGAGFDSLILGSLASGVVAIDVAGRVVSLNAGAQRILACPEGDRAAAIGRDCRDVLAPQPVVARLLLETIERKSPLSRAELQLSGTGSTIGFTLCPVTSPDGTPCGAAMLFRDLTPIEHADEQERLRERLAALGQMAADLAHELRNPLAGIEVASGLLKRRLADRPAERELVEEITGEARALADTVSASLEFVRPERPLTCPVDPVLVLEEALARALARVPFSGAVEREWQDAFPELRADPEQLRTLLVNLLVNALEAMREGGGSRLRIAVSAQRARVGSLRVDRDGKASGALPDEWEIVFSVCDDGPGIATELREKVFYPFFTTRKDGSGVGLATAQKIAASHGGCLELGTGLDGGCAFHLRLPAHGARR
jgi:signal transduction histidine kinase